MPRASTAKRASEPGVDITTLTVSLADVAALFQVSKMRISQMCHDDTLPRPTNGRYGLLATTSAYITHLKQQRANAPSREKTALVAAQVDLTKARTEEHKRRALGKEFILVADARAFALKAFMNEIGNYREQALAFPPRMAERCGGLPVGPMSLILQEEIYAMLNAFADGTDRSVNAALDYEDDPL
jgi:hypothetical protein